MLENLTFDLFAASTVPTPAEPTAQPLDAARELASIASLLARAEAKLRALDATHSHPDNASVLRRLNDVLDELQERASPAH